MGSNQLEFSRKFLASSIAEGGQQNIVLSPLSVYFALSLVAAGAQGKTLEQIVKTFGTTKKSIPEIVAPLHKAFASSKHISIANNIFVANGRKLLPKYLSDVKKYFDTEISQKECFFTNSGASCAEINKWVAQTTKGMINNIVNEVDPTSLLVIVNAIYFKATWKTVFDKNLTETNSTFYVTPKQTTKVTMMRRYQYEQVGENDVALWLKLPYLENEYSAIFVLPKENSEAAMTKAAQFLFGANPPALRTNYCQAEVAIPKFKFEYSTSLTSILQSIGITNIFEDADLSGISQDDALKVTQAIHKAVIAVDEQGTTAAAVTAFELNDEDEAQDDPFLFMANYPFYFLIEHSSTDAWVFAGKVSDPSVL